MKKLLIIIIEPVVELFCISLSYIFSYKLFVYLNRFSNLLYTYWLKRYFYTLGKGSRVCRGCEITRGKQIFIGSNTIIEKNTILAVQSNKTYPSLKIGDNVTIGESSNISSANYIEIGNDVLFGRRVTIVDNSHGEFSVEDLNISPTKRSIVSKGSIIIGEKCWIGEKVTIVGNVSIGKCSIIGAGAVVNKDIPPYSLAVGVPAKVVKKIAK